VMLQPRLGFTFMKWLNSTLRDQLGLEARITNVPGRVLRQSQFLRSLSL
jgi:hypothetical protein